MFPIRLARIGMRKEGEAPKGEELKRLREMRRKGLVCLTLTSKDSISLISFSAFRG